MVGQDIGERQEVELPESPGDEHAGQQQGQCVWATVGEPDDDALPRGVPAVAEQRIKAIVGGDEAADEHRGCQPSVRDEEVREAPDATGEQIPHPEHRGEVSADDDHVSRVKRYTGMHDRVLPTVRERLEKFGRTA